MEACWGVRDFFLDKQLTSRKTRQQPHASRWQMRP